MAYTFDGGVHVTEFKHTRRAQIRRISPAPRSVCIPMSQHIGSPCVPVVHVGDNVCRGQLIGAMGQGLSCPIHASVSGRVTKIYDRMFSAGRKVTCVEIENDFEDRLSPDIKPFEKRLSDTTPQEIIDIIKNAGIAGMGGATFPSHAKLTSAMGKVNLLIADGVECEPFITANHRLMLESPASVINGVKILLKALSLRQAYIAVEDNKLDAVAKLETLIGDSELIKVKVCKTKYPQGDERQLVYVLTGREIPPGKLPVDVGCVGFNVETCAAIFRAFSKGIPLIERVVTVDGDCVREPGNVLVPFGTSLLDVIDSCGGLKKPPFKVITGGPMMGESQWNPEIPVTKGTSAIIALSHSFEGVGHYSQPPTCIHCGKCSSVCPAHLLPNYIAAFERAGKTEEAAKFGALSCVECGACSYVCPGYFQVTQYVRAARAKLRMVKK
jgi:electron transport complex, RnfABCDGE type, C subunit